MITEVLLQGLTLDAGGILEEPSREPMSFPGDELTRYIQFNAKWWVLAGTATGPSEALPLYVEISLADVTVFTSEVE